jgi:dihydrofolate synthase/folylpolyglutamate synthase
MTYGEAIDWLFQQFPAYQKIGASAYKPDLDNIISLCDYLQIDHARLKFIHIAGTNGKGSTSSMLASTFMEKGYRTGLFTSPHILDFRERIIVNGQQIPELRVIAFCAQIQRSTLPVEPSFFEITWALALAYFIEMDCEMCIVETGLGGRLDSTNIISPVLSVITNISLDHTAILGNTLEKIAFEKAGIIKDCAPVVIGTYTSETLPVFEEVAKERQAPLFFAENYEGTNAFVSFPNTYSWENERTVRRCFEVLAEIGYSFTATEIEVGILNIAQNTGFRGRFQVISNEPLTIVDVAHNEDGIRQMLKTLSHFQKGKLHIVYGTSSDKDLSVILKLFPQDALFFMTEFSSERSAKIDQLELYAQKNQFNAKYFSNVSEAVLAAQLSASKEDTILITGSFFLVSDFF